MRKFFSKEKSGKEKKADFYILYTMVFASISLVIYGCFYFNGKALVWSHDGVPQHINALAYYGKYLRNVLKTLVFDHKISLPMWDMHIGYGSDILTTLHYYVIGDPLTLFSVFVPEKNTEILYEILIFLRIYLAGITFSIYCFYRKNPKQATFICCLVYIKKKYPILHLEKKNFELRKGSMSKLMILGIPMGLQFSITAIGTIIVQSAVNIYGATYMAGFSAAGKIQNVIGMVAVSMGATIATYVG